MRAAHAMHMPWACNVRHVCHAHATRMPHVPHVPCVPHAQVLRGLLNSAAMEGRLSTALKDEPPWHEGGPRPPSRPASRQRELPMHLNADHSLGR